MVVDFNDKMEESLFALKQSFEYEELLEVMDQEELINLVELSGENCIKSAKKRQKNLKQSLSQPTQTKAIMIDTSGGTTDSPPFSQPLEQSKVTIDTFKQKPDYIAVKSALRRSKRLKATDFTPFKTEPILKKRFRTTQDSNCLQLGLIDRVEECNDEIDALHIGVVPSGPLAGVKTRK